MTDPLDILQARYAESIAVLPNTPARFPTTPGGRRCLHAEFSDGQYHLVATFDRRERQRWSSADLDQVMRWILSYLAFQRWPGPLSMERGAGAPPALPWHARFTSTQCPGCATVFAPGWWDMAPSESASVKFDCPACRGTIRFHWVVSFGVYMLALGGTFLIVLPITMSWFRGMGELSGLVACLFLVVFMVFFLRVSLLFALALEGDAADFQPLEVPAERARESALSIARKRAAARRRGTRK